MKKLLLALTLFVLVQGCSTIEDRKIDKELAHTEPVANNAELRADAKELIKNSPNLNAVQKQKLNALTQKVQLKLEENYAETLKIKELLIKAALAEPFKPKEVKTLRDRLKKAYSDRGNITLDAVDEVNKIRGKSLMNPYMMDAFFEGKNFH